MFRVPLHSGYAEQLQNAFPEFMPFLAKRFTIGLPHSGHDGEPACTLCAVRCARRSAVKDSVKPPSLRNDANWLSICLLSIIISLLQSTIIQFATTTELSERSHVSKRCFCRKIWMQSKFCDSHKTNSCIIKYYVVLDLKA